jgi:hypothetical protein
LLAGFVAEQIGTVPPELLVTEQPAGHSRAVSPVGGPGKRPAGEMAPLPYPRFAAARLKASRSPRPGRSRP